jgi:hypothetical protein
MHGGEFVDEPLFRALAPQLVPDRAHAPTLDAHPSRHALRTLGDGAVAR